MSLACAFAAVPRRVTSASSVSMSRWQRSTAAAGVPLGATTANQPTMSKPGSFSASAGALTVTGNYVQAAGGALDIQLQVLLQTQDMRAAGLAPVLAQRAGGRARAGGEASPWKPRVQRHSIRP